MLDTRELATVLAALLFWREEICPNHDNTSWHYLQAIGMAEVAPLNSIEIKRLSARLRQSFHTK